MKLSTEFMKHLIQSLCQYHESKQSKVNAQFGFDTLWDNSMSKPTSKVPHDFNES